MEIVTLAERPDLLDAMWALRSTWPAFMLNDPVGNRLFPLVPEMFPEYQLLALDELSRVIGRIVAAPFHWGGSEEELPIRGWDAILERVVAECGRGCPATAVSLLEARVAPPSSGTGAERLLLSAARKNVRRCGIADLFGPVRPSAKSSQPRTPMRDYVAQIREDGLPEDPWLRVHARLGGRVIKICPLSMVVPGSLSQWREWTGLAFDLPGPTEVPGALTPVHVSLDDDYAVYVEPNVWIHHRLGNG